MSRFLNDAYQSLAAYVPGEQPKDMKYIKLNTNESPYPPSAGVLDAINSDAASLLKLYPDPDCAELRTKIANLFGYEKDNVFVFCRLGNNRFDSFLKITAVFRSRYH